MFGVFSRLRRICKCERKQKVLHFPNTPQQCIIIEVVESAGDAELLELLHLSFLVVLSLSLKKNFVRRLLLLSFLILAEVG